MAESSPSSQGSKTQGKRMESSKRGPIWDRYDKVTIDLTGQLILRCQECSKVIHLEQVLSRIIGIIYMEIKSSQRKDYEILRVEWQPVEQLENRASAEGSALDRLLAEIDEEEKQKRQEETGTYSGAESWISEILKQGIAVQAASKTPVDALKYWTNLLLSLFDEIGNASRKKSWFIVPKWLSRRIDMMTCPAYEGSRGARQGVSVEERNLLSFAYKHIVGTRRRSWRVIVDMQKRLDTPDQQAVGEELS
uniref:Uncharacterized protein n=1 Tax=Ditylenchus dipsaci TaxID=166011 RepID=A0A915D8Y9_9BILA